MSEIVRANGISFSYPSRMVIRDTSIQLGTGEIVALMGPSGCGKSTLLRLLGGLERPDAGTIDPSPAKLAREASLGYLFQDHDAFPWLTVAQNLRSGSGMPPYPSSESVTALLEKLGLRGTEQLFPTQLSGGMRKRLGLGRVLVRRPRLLLLDEPFSSLDLATKSEIYVILESLVGELQCAVLLVTHDLAESVLLADRILANRGQVLNLNGPGYDVALPRPRSLSVLKDAGAAAIVEFLERTLLAQPRAQ
jgi:ABC-type nitrate/sulfonate/bicarbonate transport system ATPase subunit